MKKLFTAFCTLCSIGVLLSQVIVDRITYNKTTNGSNYSGSEAGTISYVSDRKNDADSALYLNGSSYVNYSSLNVNPSTGFTYSFWIKPDADQGNTKVILSQRGVCSHSNAIEAYYHGLYKTLNFGMRTASGQATGVYVSGVTPGVWQRVTFALDPTTKKITAYKNGEYQATSPAIAATLPTALAGTFAVGNHVCVGSDVTTRYAGGIDDVVITDTYLNEGAVQASLTNFNASQYAATLVDSGAVFCEKFSIEEEFYTNDRNATTFSAQSFDGTRSIAAAKSNIGTANGFSASLWIKPQSQSGARSVVSERSSCGAVSFFEITLNGTSNTISLVLRNGSVGAGSVAANFTLDEWQKLTYTVDPTNGLLIAYVNGVEVARKTVNTNVIPASFSSTSLNIGTGACVGNDGTLRYIGDLDDLTLYNKILTPTEVLDAYNADSDDALNPAYSYSFDADTRIDNNGMNNPYRQAQGGTTNLGNPSIRSNVGYTWSFWLNTDLVSTNEAILQKRDVCSHSDMFSFHVLTDNTIHGEFRTSSQGVHSHRIDFTPNTWQNFTYVANTTNNYMYAYLDGELVDSSLFDATDFPSAYTTGIDLRVGYDICSSKSAYVGGLDDVKIYNVPLTSDQIKHLVGVQQIITATDEELVENDNLFLISPNPASDVIYIPTGEYHVLTADGNLIATGESTGSLDVSYFNKGLYIIQVDGKFGKVIIE